MSLKAKVEAIIYAAEEPITLEQIAVLLRETVLADLAAAKENAAIAEANLEAEAQDAEPEAMGPTADAESTLLPELASETADSLCPEPGPLMPPSAEANVEASLDESEAVTETGEASEESAAPPESESPALEASKEAVAETPASAEAAPAAPAAEAAAPAISATVAAPETTSRKRQPKKTEQEIAEDKAIRARLREVLAQLITDYSSEERGMEIRQVAGGFRMATKPEHHDVVRAFAKSLKPPIRLSLAALETLAVIAYKQPVTGPEITDIRGVESAGVLGTLLDRKLITTAGRKQVIGRPMQYKTSKDFLLRFGLNDVNELPSMEEFSQLASDGTIEITPSEAQESPSLFEPESQSAAAATAADGASQPSVASPETEVNQASQPSAGEDAPGHSSPEESSTAEPQSSGDPESQPDADSINTPEAAHSNGQQ